jgi:FkbM family methyltransferase
VIPIAVRIGNHRWLHNVAAALHVYPIAGAWLRRFPLQRRLKPSGTVYRITSLDELTTEFELFIEESYSPAIDGRPIETFIDLGCNAGWFALWLAARGESPKIGLLIDAHPRMVAEAAWHLRKNGLSRYVLIHGAVGLPPGQALTTFHVHPTSSASSVLPYQPDKQLPVKGRIADVEVPAVSVASEWNRHFGDVAVDLLKVDIEGTELDLMTYESDFIRERVRRIVVEWHKWCVSLEQLDAQLRATGFERLAVLKENDLAGLASYEKRA